MGRGGERWEGGGEVGMGHGDVLANRPMPRPRGEEKERACEKERGVRSVRDVGGREGAKKTRPGVAVDRAS